MIGDFVEESDGFYQLYHTINKLWTKTLDIIKSLLNKCIKLSNIAERSIREALGHALGADLLFLICIIPNMETI